MRYLLSTCCIIFATSSFNACGMISEEFENEVSPQKILSAQDVKTLVDKTVQKLNLLGNVTRKYLTSIENLQELEQESDMPGGYGRAFKESTKESLNQAPLSLNTLYTKAQTLLSFIVSTDEETRKFCTPEAFIKISQEPQTKRKTVWKDLLAVSNTTIPTIEMQMAEITSLITAQETEVGKKLDFAQAQYKKQEQHHHHNAPSQKPYTINTTAPSSTLTSSTPLFSSVPGQEEEHGAPEGQGNIGYCYSSTSQ